MPFGSDTLFIGRGVIQNNLMSLGGREENASKKIPQAYP